MPKKKKCPEFENHERWLVSYADMVTLLFAVFVVLYAIQMAGQKEEKKVAGSMQESFNTPLEDIPVDRRIGPDEKGFGIFDHMRGNQVKPSIIQKYPSEQARVTVINDDMKKIQTDLEERLYGNEKFRNQSGKGNERIVSIHRTTKGFKLQLASRYFYKSGSAQVLKDARLALDKVVEIMNEIGRPITIEGHTDSVPNQGKYDNWTLSALRAANVLKYMVREHGYPSTSLSTAAYADIRPLASNSSESGRMLNRRIELHVDYYTEPGQ